MYVPINWKSRNNNKEAKNNLDHILPRSAFSSLWVNGIPCRYRLWSKIIAASAEDLSCDLKQRCNLIWSPSCSWSASSCPLSSVSLEKSCCNFIWSKYADVTWTWISLRNISNFCSSNSGPEILNWQFEDFH